MTFGSYYFGISTIFILIVNLLFCRGIRYKDYDLYNPLLQKLFYCIQSGKAIPIERLNDDYCDCEEDGSDEPETNACVNGVFYCTYQKRFVIHIDARLTTKTKS